MGLAFSGSLSSSSIQKNDNLKNWFEKLANELNNIEMLTNNVNISSLFQFSAALEKSVSLHEINSSIFIKESVGQVNNSIKTLRRLLNISERYPPLIGTLSDFSYGFEAIYLFP